MTIARPGKRGRTPAALFAGVLTVLACAAAEEPAAPRIIHHGFLEAPELDEVSGWTVSGRRDDLLWAVADSGNPPELYAVGLEGTHRGRFLVDGVTNRDWEAVTSLTLDGQACLMIADTGDNENRHSFCRLYRVAEPVLPPGPAAATGTVAVLQTITFVYEDGPRDVEALAVDVPANTVFLLSKREVPPALYTLPLNAPSNNEPQVARRVATVPHLPQPTPQDVKDDPQYGRYRSQVTDLAFAPDGSAALVLTYKAAYRFPRAPGESWAEALQRVPEPWLLPRLRQAEALCYSRDGRAAYLTSEQRPNPLLRLVAPEESPRSLRP